MIVYLGNARLFRRLQAGIGARLFLSILPAIWIAAHPGEVQLSVEARHYSLVSLLSVLWFSTYVLHGRVISWSLFAVTLAFANVHFFSLPLILGATFFEATTLLHERRFRPLSLLVASVSVILVFTLAVRETTARRVLLLGAVLVPLFFFYIRGKSEHPFQPRYYSAFVGIGFVALVQCVGLGYKLFRRVGQRFSLSTWAHRAARAVVPVVMVLLVGLPAFTRQSFAGTSSFEAIPSNFSAYFRIYEPLKDRAAILLLQSHCWANEHPLYVLHIYRAASRCRG